MNKKQLNHIFYKILLKLYSNTKNLTSTKMPIDLVREEVYLLVLILITLEVKVTVLSLSKLQLEKIDFNILIDNAIKSVLLSCKQNIFLILSLDKSNKLEASNHWILRKIQIEEYSCLITIIKSVNSTNQLRYNSFTLVTSLIESLIIKLANYMVYELFSNGKLSEKTYLKSYAIDYLLFSYNLDNLKTYSYWKYCLEKIYLDIKRFSTDTHPLLVCTKNGLEFKRLYNKELQLSSHSSKLQRLICKYLDFIDYIRTKKS
jgi:hypothetical protein